MNKETWYKESEERCKKLEKEVADYHSRVVTITRTAIYPLALEETYECTMLEALKAHAEVPEEEQYLYSITC
jgi:hypothetical protein